MVFWYSSALVAVQQKCHLFDFLPSVGASGGCIVVWDRSKFLGSAVFQMNLATQLSSSVSLLVNTGF
jgi:hypothetical protein